VAIRRATTTDLAPRSGSPDGLAPAHRRRTCGGSQVAFDTRSFFSPWSPVFRVLSASHPSIFPWYGRSPVFYPRVCCPFPTKHRRHRMDERDDLTPRSPPVHRYCSNKQHHLSCQEESSFVNKRALDGRRASILFCLVTSSQKANSLVYVVKR
jgi:hypothetical protein